MKPAPIDPDSSETGPGEQYQGARPIKSQIQNWFRRPDLEPDDPFKPPRTQRAPRAFDDAAEAECRLSICFFFVTFP